MCASECSPLALSWTVRAQVQATTYTRVGRLCSQPRKVLATGASRAEHGDQGASQDCPLLSATAQLVPKETAALYINTLQTTTGTL